MVSVLVVGAGAAGLTAAYNLVRSGVNVTILEANAFLGGRARKLEGFADFPIDIGCEWVRRQGDLAQIVNNPNVTIPTTILHDTNPSSIWEDGFLEPWSFELGEYKWINFTWFDFFDQIIAPPVKEHIKFNCQVTSLDYTGKPTATCADGRSFQGDKVIVTVPMSILQGDVITFNPPLSNPVRNAINDFDFQPGFKVFMRFRQKFYPNFLFVSADDGVSGERTWYDETFGQTTQDNVMGLFVYGSLTAPYYGLGGENAMKDQVLSELDNVFNGQASQFYIEHHIQDWTKEAFIKGAYTQTVADTGSIAFLQEPINDKLLFAGDALPVNDLAWGYASEAAFSGELAARNAMDLLGVTPVSGSVALVARWKYCWVWTGMLLLPVFHAIVS